MLMVDIYVVLMVSVNDFIYGFSNLSKSWGRILCHGLLCVSIPASIYGVLLKWWCLTSNWYCNVVFYQKMQSIYYGLYIHISEPIKGYCKMYMLRIPILASVAFHRKATIHILMFPVFGITGCFHFVGHIWVSDWSYSGDFQCLLFHLLNIWIIKG